MQEFMTMNQPECHCVEVIQKLSDSYLRAACGSYHPDDASRVIISELWRTLQP